MHCSHLSEYIFFLYFLFFPLNNWTEVAVREHHFSIHIFLRMVFISCLTDYYVLIHYHTNKLSVYLCVAVGNEKANSYWEKELPAHFERSEIEKFIRAK